jgi:NhaP-type Na+/H+ or K+/H+ antiporter
VRRYSNFEIDIVLDSRCILLYSTTICATDSVAALAMIKADTFPKLFSVVFGEGMVNDAVAIILFQAIYNLVGTSNPNI